MPLHAANNPYGQTLVYSGPDPIGKTRKEEPVWHILPLAHSLQINDTWEVSTLILSMDPSLYDLNDINGYLEPNQNYLIDRLLSHGDNTYRFLLVRKDKESNISTLCMKLNDQAKTISSLFCSKFMNQKTYSVLSKRKQQYYERLLTDETVHQIQSFCTIR